MQIDNVIRSKASGAVRSVIGVVLTTEALRPASATSRVLQLDCENINNRLYCKRHAKIGMHFANPYCTVDTVFCIAAILLNYKNNTLRTVLTNSGNLILGLLTSSLLSHWIGPSGRGQLTAVMLWPMLLAYIVSMGMMSASVYFAAQEDVKTGSLLTNLTAISVVQSLVAIPLGSLLLPYLLHAQTPQVLADSRLFLLVIPASLLSISFCRILLGRLFISITNYVSFIVPSGYLAGSLALHFTNHTSVHNLVLLNLALNYVLLVATAVVLYVVKIRAAAPSLPLAKRMFQYGFQVQVGDLAGAANLRLDQVLITAWLPAAQLGLYSAAVNAVNVGQLLSTSVRTTATPTVARKSTHEGRLETLAKIFRKYWVISLLSNGLLALTLPVLLPLIYGKPFIESLPTAEVLLIGTILFGAKDVLSGGAQALGRPWVGSRSDLFAAVVTVVSLLLLLPRLGIMGAAIASVLAYGTELAVVVLLLNRTDNLSMRTLLYIQIEDVTQTVGEIRSMVRGKLLNLSVK